MATVRNALGRVARAWGALAADQRLAAGAAGGLVLTMFFPWYKVSAFDQKLHHFVDKNRSAWASVTFIEAALFLVAVGVLLLLFYRAEKRAFHLPGGDGTVIFAAGVWSTFLVFWRVFDQPDLGAGSTGIQWGIFFAFVATGLLTYAGWRMRMARHAEPTAAQDPTTKVEPMPPPRQETLPTERRRRRIAGAGGSESPTEIAGQMSFEDDPSET